jgi:hypothetical protein
VAFAAGVTLMLAPAGFAQLTDAEFKCQLLVNKAGAKFIKSKMKCLDRCFKAFWAGDVPSTDCLPPDYGGATAICIGDASFALKGAENKFASAIKKACDIATKPRTQCPICYSGGDCSASGFATAHVDDFEGQVDSISLGVFCEPGANAGERTCQLETAKLITKQITGATKCYTTCRSNARKGNIPPESCDAPATDPPTAECLARLIAKTKRGIDGVCRNDNAIPDCLSTDDYPDGETWAFLVDLAVGGNQGLLFCGSITSTSTSTTSTLATTTSTTGAPTTSSTSTTSTSSSTSLDPNATTTTSTTLESQARFDFTSSATIGTCGNTYRDLAETIPLKNLLCGRISIGGGSSQVPDNVVPAGATNRFNLTKCIGTTCGITGAVPGSTPPGVDCTWVGCPFGVPLPISNAGLSLCVTNTFSAFPTGTIDTATGAATWSFPLSSKTILTGNPTQPCPICAVSVGGAPCAGSPGSPCTGVCDGSPNQGAACQSTNPNGLSNDCPAPAVVAGAAGQRCYRGLNNGAGCARGADCPGGLCSSFVGDIALHSSPLTTGAASLSSSFDNSLCTGPGTPQACCTNVGTGNCNVFCPGQSVSQRGAFLSPICLGGTNDGEPCATLADCPGGTSCRNGVLNNYCVGGANDGLGCSSAASCPSPGVCSKAGTLAQVIRASGAAAGPLSFGVAQPIGLASVFCVPTTTSAVVNANANLPGPSAATLAGTIILVP